MVYGREMKDQERGSMKHRSVTVHVGPERIPHRALFRAIGLDDSDFRKLLIAIINSYSETSPGHIHLRSIAEAVREGIREMGGVPWSSMLSQFVTE